MKSKKRWYGLYQKNYGLVAIHSFTKKPGVGYYLEALGEPSPVPYSHFSIREITIHEKYGALLEYIGKKRKKFHVRLKDNNTLMNEAIVQIWDELYEYAKNL